MSLGMRFGTAADDYEHGRPGYPHDAVAWLLRDVTGPVADVGAGTGKLTSAIAAHGFDVTAVDPDAGMLAALRRTQPHVPTAIGAAESLPFADAALGAVTLGQAWHWVDVPAASAEIARVVRPGGVLGLVWNIRDESTPWVAALSAVLGSSAAESMMGGERVRVAAPFEHLDECVWRWERRTTPAQLRAMVRSRSHYIAADEEVRARVDAGVQEVLRGLDSTSFALPYVTYAFRTTRP